MLDSSRDTLLDLEPPSASLLKLAVATVLTIAKVATMIAAILQFPQLHSDQELMSRRSV